MSATAIKLNVLPAGFGDCLLVECPVGKRQWRMLVDTGPDETYPALRARLAKLPPNALGKRHIDVFVVTHIDHDHIGGAGLLLNDKSLGLSFGDIWFNAPPRQLARGVAEGQALAGLLGAAAQPLPWNLAFGGAGVVCPAEPGFIELPAASGTPRITLLSPTPDRLAALFKVWARELARLRTKAAAKALPLEPGSRGTLRLDIPALAARSTATDRSVANGSAIALLLEHRGVALLLGADAFPTVLVPALGALARHRKQAGPLTVDAFKLSHHGSRANVTRALLAAVQAKHYVFSTNNAIFNHPDDESVARVLVHGGRQPSLWFNYATPRNLRWSDVQLKSRFGYDANYPTDSDNGVSLDLSANRTVVDGATRPKG